jgi:hypothetical protein
MNREALVEQVGGVSASDPYKLAEGWAASFDRIRSAVGVEAMRNMLARRLVFHLAGIELEWAHPVMRQAFQIRAEQIVAEIGWPKKGWLDKRVKREVAFRNAFHAWLDQGAHDVAPAREASADAIEAASGMSASGQDAEERVERPGESRVP